MLLAAESRSYDSGSPCLGLIGFRARGSPKTSANITAAAGPCLPRSTICSVSMTGEVLPNPATVVARVVAVRAGLMGAETAVDGASGVTGRRTGRASTRGSGGGAGGVGRV